jgi:hypothetical protein
MMAGKRSKSSRRCKKEDVQSAQGAPNAGSNLDQASCADETASSALDIKEPRCAVSSAQESAKATMNSQSPMDSGMVCGTPTEPENTGKESSCVDKVAEPVACDAQQHNSAEPPTKISKQHHVSRILDAVLEEDIPADIDAGITKRFHYPVYVDGLLAFGLLVAVAGFTIGLFKMYVNHQAQQHIMQGDYKTAIAILQGSPTPPMFTVDGHDPDEALSQALYLDALHKFEDGDSNQAWVELQQIRPGSKYFDQSQRILAENFIPAETTLECTISNEASLQAASQP